MDAGEWVGIVFFLCIFGAITIVMLFRYRGKQETQQTLRKAIDQGQTLSEDMIRALSGGVPAANRDLRRGIVLIAVGIAVYGFGFLLDDDDASTVFYGAGLFPLLVGGAYLLMHRFAGQPQG